MNKYIHIVTVTVKAPKNNKPRQTSINAAVLSEKSSYRKRAEEDVLNVVKKHYSQPQFRGINLKFSVSSETRKISLIMADSDIEKLHVTKAVES
jgi:hypothetical protein